MCIFEDVLDCSGYTGQQASGHVPHGQPSWHVGRVNWSERESVATQFAVLFAAVAHPLNQAFLVDVFDGSCANAREEKGPLGATFATAHSTDVCLMVVVGHSAWNLG